MERMHRVSTLALLALDMLRKPLEASSLLQRVRLVLHTLRAEVADANVLRGVLGHARARALEILHSTCVCHVTSPSGRGLLAMPRMSRMRPFSVVALYVLFGATSL